jgi:hypothetical protein
MLLARLRRRPAYWANCLMLPKAAGKAILSGGTSVRQVDGPPGRVRDLQEVIYGEVSGPAQLERVG